MSAAMDPLIALLSKAVDVKLTFAAGVTVQFYDTAINLADECAFIWRQPWSVGKTMYLLTRYSVFIDSILILWYQFYPGNTIKSCQTIYIVGSWFMTSGIILCEIILILRTYAIWGKNKLVLAYMASVQTAAIILSVYFMHESIKATTFISLVSPSIITCLPVLGNNRMLIVYCCIIVAESNVLFLSLYRGFTQWKRDSTPLVRVLYRDGVIHFAVLFSISLANALIVSELFNSPFYYILSLMQRIFHSILTSHLIMNVRKAAIGREHQLECFVNSSFSVTRVKYMENLSFSSGISPTDRTYEIELR